MTAEFDRDKAVCFTGHRSLPSGTEYSRLIRMTDTAIAAAYSHGYRHFICGGAVGFDTLAACRVITLRKRLPDMKLHMALPCRNQTEKWGTESIRMYKFILGQADTVEYVATLYTSTCMLERNRLMVDSSAVCIAYCNKPTGGSRYTVNYATKNGLGVINLASDAITADAFLKFRNRTV